MNAIQQIITNIAKIEAAFELSEGKALNFKGNVESLNIKLNIHTLNKLISKGEQLLDDVYEAHLNADALNQPRYDFVDGCEDFREITRQAIRQACDDSQ